MPSKEVIRVLIATTAELPDAQALVFEYMAGTQREAGRTVPASINQLPSVLQTECANLATTYQPPGALLLAYRNHEPIGCVGLKPIPPPGTIEVKRLYVRPTHRRGGIARLLMRHAHRYAAGRGFTRLVLDVMPTRSHVIDFYRRLGYTNTEPYRTEAPGPMIYLDRPTNLRPSYHRGVATFDGTDGTRLVYHRAGEGEPLICLPGGPMQSAAYLGDLGGLSAHRSLILLDLRGTGQSAEPADPASYRCDRLVDDVEALRAHLGRDRIDLLGHSAGAAVAVLYAARFPDRVGRFVLLNPSPRPVGLEISDADRRQVAELRRGEAWFPAAFAAFERIWSGEATAADWKAITPFTHGRWDTARRAWHAEQPSEKNPEAAAVYYSAGALAPEATRIALATLQSRTLLVAGEYDVALPPKRAAEYAGLFGLAQLAVQPRGGHYPWLDDPEWLVQTLAAFLR